MRPRNEEYIKFSSKILYHTLRFLSIGKREKCGKFPAFAGLYLLITFPPFSLFLFLCSKKYNGEYKIEVHTREESPFWKKLP